MKKILFLLLSLVLILSLASCVGGNDDSKTNESEAVSNSSSSEVSEDISKEESQKSVLDMTSDELKVIYGDLEILDLGTKSGEINSKLSFELKQTGMTETYEVTTTEKMSVRDSGIIKKSVEQNIVGYLTDVTSSYIFDDGMAYIYSDIGKYKAPCSFDEFEKMINGEEDDDVDVSSTLKALESTDEYVVIQSTLVVDETSTQFVKDTFVDFLSALMPYGDFDNFTLVSAVEKAKFEGEFISGMESEILIKITPYGEEIEVAISSVIDIIDKDPMISVPTADDGYFELPKINAVMKLSEKIDEFYYSEFISFDQLQTFEINSTRESISSVVDQKVMIIYPDDVLKFKIISDIKEQGINSESVVTYDGPKYQAVVDGETESITMSQDDASSLLMNYYSTFLLANVNTDLVSVTEENSVIAFTCTVNDEMFGSIAQNLIYSMFSEPSKVTLKETKTKNVRYTMKDDELLSAGYELEFTCEFDSEIYVLKMFVELDNINPIDETTKDLDA